MDLPLDANRPVIRTCNQRERSIKRRHVYAMAAHPQSLSPVIPSGRGAMVAAISTFPVPIRSREQFSQEQPPCCSQKRSEKSEKRFIHHKQRGRLRYFITIAHPTITHGNAADTRSSSAASIKVCVPPPEAPVQPIRSVSIAGSEQIQSKDRMETHVKRLQSERDLSIARMYIQIREHRHVPHRRDEPPLSLCDHK